MGEPIRLLPCMHYYHMRCIDDWLMRSYSCPTCMERVDVGMRETISTTSASHQPNLRRRRRRRGRRERRSTSSTHSGASLVSVQTPVERCSKERGSNCRQFLVSEAYDERLAALAGQSGQEGRQENETGGVRYQDAAVSTTDSETGNLTSARQGCEGLHEITVHGIEHTSYDSPSDQELPCSIDQIIRISNFEVDPQDPQYPPLSLMDTSASPSSHTVPLSPPAFEYHPGYPPISLMDTSASSSSHTVPLSPPAFEYHFEFPLSLQTNYSSQENDCS